MQTSDDYLDPVLFKTFIDTTRDAALITAAANLAIAMGKPDTSSDSHDEESYRHELYLRRFDKIYQDLKTLIVG